MNTPWEWLTPGIALAGFLVLLFFGWWWSLGRAALRQEHNKNEDTPVPEDKQLRWHVQHMREDTLLIGRLLMLIAAILAGLFVLLLFRLG